MTAFEPIGIYHCAETYRYEAPRQGVFGGRSGVIELLPRHNYEDALRDLDGFGRIWVLFVFHLNENWRPTVRPPVAPDGRRIGVFATRAPHRPNPIGLSCVALDGLERLRLRVSESDLLDGTPVLDIKPYIPQADSFPEARRGWLDELAPDAEWRVEFTAEALAKAELLRKIAAFDLRGICTIQLAHDPFSSEHKRLGRDGDGAWTIGFRMWKAVFDAAQETRTVTVRDIRSNYSAEELAPGTPDRYGDKEFHREFLRRFAACEAAGRKDRP